MTLKQIVTNKNFLGEHLDPLEEEAMPLVKLSVNLFKPAGYFNLHRNPWLHVWTIVQVHVCKQE